MLGKLLEANLLEPGLNFLDIVTSEVDQTGAALHLSVIPVQACTAMAQPQHFPELLLVTD